MANVNHNTLTDPYLHEPKGVASAATGKVYVANGAGSGAWTAKETLVGETLTGYIEKCFCCFLKCMYLSPLLAL
jgi:hypothetical protein